MPIGWNAYYVRNSPHTLDILQSLGFKSLLSKLAENSARTYPE
jgi:hypothetical protein